MTATTTRPAVRFELPRDLVATEPAEARGLRRDQVRLLVAGSGRLRHAQFADLGHFLRPGDLLVVNTSATRHGALDGTRADGTRVVVHLGGRLVEGGWLVELRSAVTAERPVLDGERGERVRVAWGAVVTLRQPARTASAKPGHTRLWRADVAVEAGGVDELLAAAGRPIAYGYLHERWPLSCYQTVFAREPGSAEMPSAGRPFSTRLVTDLVAAGIGVAPVLLHTGLSSLERGEAPPDERFHVPARSAALVDLTRRTGGRVVAVGTTVVRALESLPDRDGWTDVVISPERPVRLVDGIVTGFHSPEASHLLMLEAVAGADVVQQAYAAALEQEYRWHEFGDSCLLLRG